MRSRSFLNDFAHETVQTSHVFLLVFRTVSNILTGSKGRDKFLGLIQQVADLYKQCMIDYLASYRVKEWPIGVQNAHSLYVAIKNARKFFRLMKGVEELAGAGEKLKCDISFVLALKIIRHIIGVFYFAADNILWFIHVGVTSDLFNHSFLEKLKDSLSLLRYILRMSIFIITTQVDSNSEERLIRELYNNEVCINCGSFEVAIVQKLLKARRKRRFQAFEMIINILRVLMLWKSLKLPGTKSVSSIFYSVCGCVSSSFSLFKLLNREDLD